MLFTPSKTENKIMGWDKDSVKALRLRLGLTQIEFAKKLGCRQQTISEWEQGVYLPANAYGRLLDFIQETAPNLSSLGQRAVKNFEEFFDEKIVITEPKLPEVHEPVMDRPFDPAID